VEHRDAAVDGVDVGEGVAVDGDDVGVETGRKPALTVREVARGSCMVSAPALPRNCAMSVMAYGSTWCGLWGPIPASRPMTTRVPPSISERIRARA